MDPIDLVIEVFRDVASEWRWRAQTANGRIVAISGEGYINENDCVDIVNRLFRGGVEHVEIKILH